MHHWTIKKHLLGCKLSKVDYRRQNEPTVVSNLLLVKTSGKRKIKKLLHSKWL